MKTTDIILEHYLKDISGNVILSKKEMDALSFVIMNKRGTKEYNEARQKMIIHNLPLSVNIAKKYYSYLVSHSNLNISMLDLIQVGNIGLMKAVDNYDASTGNTFSTYASFYIIGNIQRHIVNFAEFVRLPSHHIKHIIAIKKIENEFGTIEDYDDMRKKMNITCETMKKLKDGMRCKRAEIEDWNLFINDVAGTDCDIVKQINDKELSTYLLEKINSLKPTHSKLIYDRYILEKSMSEIALELNVSRQFVHQTLKIALDKMKKLIENDDKLEINKEKNNENK